MLYFFTFFEKSVKKLGANKIMLSSEIERR